ncbi:MAG: hypothetical protein ACLPKB_03945 [Xanthobacteraceae bacterium]
MTSFRQIEANRRNALRSTGPKTEQGKRRSRRNAVRHGLTAETVISALEDSEDYRAFEGTITADYDAQTAVERELVLRLASLLWRIRRATAIETDLLQIQAEILRDRQQPLDVVAATDPEARSNVYRLLKTVRPSQGEHREDGRNHYDDQSNTTDEQYDQLSEAPDAPVSPSRELTHCFMRLANLDNGLFERLGRYEKALWRQTVQTLFALRAARYR